MNNPLLQILGLFKRKEKIVTIKSNEHLTLALSQIGVKEIVGKKHNPIIVNYFKEIGFEWVKDDETPWCGAFLSWVCKSTNYEYSKTLNSRSWLKVGVEAKDPKQGDVAVFYNGTKSGNSGHCGLYISETKTHINVLGGNQSNAVNIIPFPKKRLLGYRKLSKTTTNAII